MLFNSIQYLFFFPVVILSYYFLKDVSKRLLLLLISSYIFYMCWNPIFILLIIVSTIVDYIVGNQIDRTTDKSKKKAFLFLSLIANLGILSYFKYYNFLLENLNYILSSLELNYTIPAASILLPVGISFYTFQTLSYTIDVYRGQRKSEKSFLAFAVFVSFFPQLVAGPIERSTTLLPQLKKLSNPNHLMIRKGLELILWGLFKKIVVADRLAEYVNIVFESPSEFYTAQLITAAIFFSFQIYCDFSGYSDIAIGSAKVLGIKLMDNFKGPYFSLSIQEFWRRWHISLSTWFRDYLYIPLGGNRISSQRTYYNLVLVFLATGIWHGANWTFIIWGLYHGFFLIVERLGFIRILNKLPNTFNYIYTYLVVTIGWILFRAKNIDDVILYFSNMTKSNGFNINIYQNSLDILELQISLFVLVFIAFMHWYERKGDINIFLSNFHKAIRWGFYILLSLSVLILGQYGEHSQFIYFQF